jgi:hypothetical protein
MFPIDTPLSMVIRIDGFSIGTRMALVIKEQDDYTICFKLLASDIHVQNGTGAISECFSIISDKSTPNIKLRKDLIMDWADCSNELPLLLGWKYTYPLLADLIKELEICDIAKAKAHPSNG